MKRSLVVLLAVVLCAGLVAGCGTANAIQGARTSLDKAKAAGAESKAPFEYYAAGEYLGNAVHEAEEGDNKSADMFTKQSADYSAKALGLSTGGAK